MGLPEVNRLKGKLPGETDEFLDVSSSLVDTASDKGANG